MTPTDASRTALIKAASQAVERDRREQMHRYGGAHPAPTGRTLETIVDTVQSLLVGPEVPEEWRWCSAHDEPVRMPCKHLGPWEAGEPFKCGTCGGRGCLGCDNGYATNGRWGKCPGPHDRLRRVADASRLTQDSAP